LLPYLLITYLLSFIGFAIYRMMIQSKTSLRFQRRSLQAIILACFIIPMLVYSSLQFNYYTTEYINEEYVQLCDSFCPSEESIEACYDVAITESEFCNCASVEKENLIVYKSNSIYNFWLYNASTVKIISIFSGLVLLFFLFIKLASLQYIIRTSQKKRIVVQGEEYIILKPEINLPVASFRLNKKYIIWESGIDHLSKEEKSAILYHEIAHIKNYDTWLKIGENLIWVFWLINPIFYIIKNEFKLLAEYMADEYAVLKTGDKKAYASLLLKMQKQNSLPLAHAYSNGLLKERITRILTQNDTSKSYAGLGFVLLTTLYISVSAITFTTINHQIGKIEIYQTLSTEHQNSGKTVFCKQCVLEELH